MMGDKFTVRGEWVMGLMVVILGFFFLTIVTHEGRISKVETAISSLPKIEAGIEKMQSALNAHYERETARDKR